jgi:hypothetical protein
VFGLVAAWISPEMVTLPVARITVPLGTVSVAPEATVKLVNCSVPLGGLDVQSAEPKLPAPSEPSP